MVKILNRWGRFLRLLIGGCLLLCSLGVHAEPETGWWWNPAESGRGYFIEILDGGVLFFGSYLYEADGRGTWQIAVGPVGQDYSYTGQLQAFSGGQTLTGDYVPPSGPTNPGTISLNFSDDAHGTLTGPGGTIPIERFHFDAAEASFQPYVGWWWNEQESGRGFSLAVEGGHLFLIGYMYDLAGNPVWYLSAGTMTSPTSYAGPLQQFANGQTLTGPYRAPGAPVNVGQVAITFSADDVATITLSDGTAFAASGSATISAVRSRIFTVRPYRTANPLANLPPGWKGTLQSDYVLHEEDPVLGTTDIHLVFQGNITWGDAIDSLPPVRNRHYSVVSGTFQLTGDEKSVDPVIGTCTSHYTVSSALPPTYDLTLDGRGVYHGSISTVVSGERSETCILTDGKTETTEHLPVYEPIVIILRGTGVYGLHGRPAPQTLMFGTTKITRKDSWDFTAVR